MPRPIHPFLSYAFRPFFLLNAVFAVVVILLWVAVLTGRGPATLPANTVLWHGHEMLVGFVLATVAGFVLTAAATWTGREPVNGLPLALLVLAWLAGRCVMLLAGVLPALIVLLVDMVFPVALLGFVAREIIAARSKRNYPIVAITLVFAVLNLVYHLGRIGTIAGGDRLALLLFVHTVLLLISVIGGRVIPNFTANWLRARGHARMPANNALLGQASIFLTLLVGIAASVASANPITGVIAFAAAALHAVRLIQWRGFATTGEPLMLVLHVAYCWLPIGYALVGCAVFGWFVAPAIALHALTIGAIGTMILAMTTRVSLGHTGRPLIAARTTAVAYVLLTLAVLARIAGPLFTTNAQAAITWSAAGWVVAFAIFVWVYWPVLAGPRIDTD